MNRDERERLGRKIKDLRKGRGWSLAKLGELVSREQKRPQPYRPQAVRQWETGGGVREAETLFAIAAVFSLTLDALRDSGSPAGTEATASTTQSFLDELHRVVVGPFHAVAPSLDNKLRREVLEHFERQTRWAVTWYQTGAPAGAAEALPGGSRRRLPVTGDAGKGRAK